MKSIQKARMESFKGMKIKLTEDFSTMTEVKVLKENNFQSKIMYLEKLSFKNESKDIFR